MTIEELKNYAKSYRNGEISLDEIVKFFQEFIDGDPKIINSTYLKKTPELKQLYSFLVYYKKKIISKLKFPKPATPKNSFSYLKSFDDIQDFIIKNNVLSPGDMVRRFRGADTIKNKILSAEEKNKLKWPNYSRLDFSYIKTVEDFQKLIDENDIRQPIELKTKISDGLYGKYYTLLSREERAKIKWKNERTPKTYPEERRDWSSIDTIEKLQQFIFDNNVINKTDLRKRFRGLYRKFMDKLSEVIFVGPLTITTGEALLIKELIKYNINFLYQKTYPDCKNILALRFDLYLIDYNILLEYHGSAHFGVGIWYDEELIENDKAKNKYAKDNGIPIFYYTLEKKLYEEHGYFDKVYTDLQELFDVMGVDTSKINPNYEKDIKTYFAQDINYFNSFIYRNKVGSLKELREKYPAMYERVKRKKFKNFLVYYKDS